MRSLLEIQEMPFGHASQIRFSRLGQGIPRVDFRGS